MMCKVMTYEQFREMVKEDAYLWFQNGTKADDLTAKMILNEYPKDYFDFDGEEEDELPEWRGRCWSPEEIVEGTISALRDIEEEENSEEEDEE